MDRYLFFVRARISFVKKLRALIVNGLLTKSRLISLRMS